MKYVVYGTPFHFQNWNIYKEVDVHAEVLSRKEGSFVRPIKSSVYKDWDSSEEHNDHQYYYSPICVFGFDSTIEAKVYIAKNRLRFLNKQLALKNPCILGEYNKTLKYLEKQKAIHPDFFI